MELPTLKPNGLAPRHGFDPHDPEIERLMWSRAKDQGAALRESSGHGLVFGHPDAWLVITGFDPATFTFTVELTDKGREAITAATAAFVEIGKAMTKMAEAIAKEAQPLMDALGALFPEQKPRPVISPHWAGHRPLMGVVDEVASVDWDRLEAAFGTKKLSPVLDRQRHGRAALCPKHGPTKGGLCRRCTR